MMLGLVTQAQQSQWRSGRVPASKCENAGSSLLTGSAIFVFAEIQKFQSKFSACTDP